MLNGLLKTSVNQIITSLRRATFIKTVKGGDFLKQCLRFERGLGGKTKELTPAQLIKTIN